MNSEVTKSADDTQLFKKFMVMLITELQKWMGNKIYKRFSADKCKITSIGKTVDKITGSKWAIIT